MQVKAPLLINGREIRTKLVAQTRLSFLPRTRKTTALRYNRQQPRNSFLMVGAFAWRPKWPPITGPLEMQDGDGRGFLVAPQVPRPLSRR